MSVTDTYSFNCDGKETISRIIYIIIVYNNLNITVIVRNNFQTHFYYDNIQQFRISIVIQVGQVKALELRCKAYLKSTEEL